MAKADVSVVAWGSDVFDINRSIDPLTRVYGRKRWGEDFKEKWVRQRVRGVKTHLSETENEDRSKANSSFLPHPTYP